MDALPFVDMIEADKIDLLLISHFHLDHAGALPWSELFISSMLCCRQGLQMGGRNAPT